MIEHQYMMLVGILLVIAAEINEDDGIPYRIASIVFVICSIIESFLGR